MVISALAVFVAHSCSAYTAPAVFGARQAVAVRPQVARVAMSSVASGSVYEALGFDDDEVAQGEDITAKLADLAAADGDKPSEVQELTPVQPVVNAQALEDALARWKKHPSDCGSAQVQVARLSERIKYLTSHLAKNRKDKSTERGLVTLANRRRKLLKYLINEDQKVFEELSAHYEIRTRKIVEESLGVQRRGKSRTGGSKE